MLKSTRTANIFERKMLKAGKMPPLAIVTKTPTRKRQKLSEA